MAVGFKPDRSPFAAPKQIYATQEAQYRIKAALTPATEDPQKDGYVCPICGSGQGQHHTGITENRNNPYHFTCWAGGCTASGEYKSCSAIDLLARYLHIKGTAAEQYKQVMQYLNIRIDPRVPVPKGRRPIEIQTEEQKARARQLRKELESADYTEKYAEWHASLLKAPAGSDIRAYLRKKGITDEAVEHFNLGYDKAWQHPSTKGLQRKRSSRLIYPRSKNSYQARSLADVNPKYQKLIVGSANTLYLPAFDSTQTIQIIVEGESDTITLWQLQLKCSIIGLGSINNAEYAVDFLLQTQKKYYHTISHLVLVALDNDFGKEHTTGKNPGQEAQRRLVARLQEKGILALGADALSLYGDPSLYKGADKVDLNDTYIKFGADVLKERLSKQLYRLDELYLQQMESGSPDIPIDPAAADALATDSLISQGELANHISKEEEKENTSVIEQDITNQQDTAEIADKAQTDCSCSIDDEGFDKEGERLKGCTADIDTAQSLSLRNRVLSICGGCEFYLTKKNGKLNVEGFRAKCTDCKSLIQADIYQSDLIECFLDDHKGKGTIIAKRYGKTIERLYAEGKSDREIAKTLDISHMSVYRYLKSHDLK